MNAGRQTRNLSGAAIAAMAISAVIVLLLAGAAAVAFFTGHGSQASSNDVSRFDTSSSVAVAMGNEPTGPNAAHIKEADADFPLADKITVYDGEGERMALADLDPEVYAGFAAYVTDSFVEGLGDIADGSELAEGVKYVAGNVVSATSLETLSAYVDSSSDMSQGDILFVEPNYKVGIIDEDLVELIDSNSDEGLTDQAQSDGASQLGLTNDYYSNSQTEFGVINIESAWAETMGSEDVVVAVLDGGLMGTGNSLARDTTAATLKHEDIDYDNHVIPGYNFIANTDSTEDIANSSVSGSGHGTFVAGQIIATANNGKGVSGVAPGVKVAPYKVFDVAAKDSTTKIGTITAIYQAVLMAASNGVDVVNMSLGWETNFSEVCYLACQAATEEGTILIAAAGNSKTDRNTYPAAYDCVIGVAATDKVNGDFTTSWSSATGSNYGENNVVVAAPGTKIYGIGVSSATNYVSNNGTSMASPIVASVAALAKSVDKSLNTARFYKLLKDTSTAKTYSETSSTEGSTYDDHYGWGVINAGNLIKALKDDKDAGITYPASGMSGEVCWQISSEGAMDIWPVTPNDRCFWVPAYTGKDYPWDDYKDLLKSVRVDKGVNVREHVYYAFVSDGRALYAVTFDYKPTLSLAFADARNCEVFDLSGIIADNDVPAGDIFKGCVSARQIELGDSFEAVATFPECDNTEDMVFLGWRVIPKGVTTLSETLYKPGDPIPASAGSFEAVYGEPGSEELPEGGGDITINPDDPSGPIEDDGTIKSTQLSVTMPLDLHLSFGNFGLSKVKQLDRGYALYNSGTTGLKVVDVEMIDPASDFDVDAIYKRGDSGYLNYNEQPITKNTIMLVYDDGTNYTYIGDRHPLSAARQIADGAINDLYPFKSKTEVTIPAGGQLKVSFEDSICFIPTQIPPTSGNNQLCKIVYTVAAA